MLNFSCRKSNITCRLILITVLNKLFINFAGYSIPALNLSDYIQNISFCQTLLEYNRRISREVSIGDIPVGAANPIRVQSMTNTPNRDIRTTANQIVELANAGCDYVRLSVPSVSDVGFIKDIRNLTRKEGCSVPLIADVHYNPVIAEKIAPFVEKVRINPGNYADTKSLVPELFTDKEFDLGTERIFDSVRPLVTICKTNGTAIRVGVNHGSLSDRIMSRYGDTSIGMAESAMEYLRAFAASGFHNIVLSVKSSNTVVMVEAYRLLVIKMAEENMNYPLHLGVTEAGEGEDGTVKSALGIGALLEDGIGDTIRVSLAGNPLNELPLALKLADIYNRRLSSKLSADASFQDILYLRSAKSKPAGPVGGSNQPVVIITESNHNHLSKNLKPDLTARTNEAQELRINNPRFSSLSKSGVVTVFNSDTFADHNSPLEIKFLTVHTISETEQISGILKKQEKAIIVLDTDKLDFHSVRKSILSLKAKSILNPVILKGRVDHNELDSVYYSVTFGPLLADRLADGIWFYGGLDVSPDYCNKLAFDILQASKRRIYKTEFVQCPSCARTLFDIDEVARQIREATGHLKGITIGIMGCIVNGLGEMGDADYGIIGSGTAKVSLYKKQKLVKKNVSTHTITDELISLIKEDGNWQKK